MQHAFTYGVYSPSVGFTTAFGTQAKQLVALSGICIAIGEVVGKVLEPMLLKLNNKWCRHQSDMHSNSLSWPNLIFCPFLVFDSKPYLVPTHGSFL